MKSGGVCNCDGNALLEDSRDMVNTYCWVCMVIDPCLAIGVMIPVTSPHKVPCTFKRFLRTIVNICFEGY